MLSLQFGMHHSRKPLYMVVCCTLLASIAQILFKIAMQHTSPAGSPNRAMSAGAVLALATNLPLLAGFFFHG